MWLIFEQKTYGEKKANAGAKCSNDICLRSGICYSDLYLLLWANDRLRVTPVQFRGILWNPNLIHNESPLSCSYKRRQFAKPR